MRSTVFSLATALLGLLLAAAPLVPGAEAGYWMDDVPHVGKSPFNTNPSYVVYRNVKAYGAKGDGVTDDTAAINRAISDGNRCGPQVCTESTVSPAIVYFPAGTYLISGSIIDYFYTQLIGDPTNRPVIKAKANFPTTTTLGLLDGNRYGADGLAWKAVNVFYRQVRNLIFDTTAIPASSNAVAVHWPSSQATTLSNVEFRLAAGAASKHIGLFIEEGSGGILTDLVFTGGWKAASLGNQQYTARAWTISNAQIAIEQLWDWGWTYQGLKISSCPVGIKIADANTGSITLLDSTFTSVTTAIQTGVDVPYAQYPAAGSLVIYNTVFASCATIVKSPTKVLLVGSASGSITVTGYVLGRTYTPTGPTQMAGQNAALFPVAASLRRNNAIYSRSKPTYSDVPASRVATARAFGAKGDGATDDLVALQNLFNHVAANPTKIAFVDAGHYVVSDTLVIPPGARIVGEALASYIVGFGSKFSNAASPRPVVRVGAAGGQAGTVEWSDMIVSTRGAAAGAKVIEWNLASTAAAPSGMWDVHVRIGGYAGSNHGIANCPVGVTPVSGCVGAYISMHITAPASNLLMEGTWFWVADHDIEDQGYGQVSVYAGRGVLIEATAGNIWLSGVGSEHHSMYQFQLANTKNIFMAQAQSETPYYQPNPVAPQPITIRAAMGDPDFADCANGGGKLAGAPCAMAWGLRVVGSKDVSIFGAGFYSFFNNNSDACAQEGAAVDCQSRIVDVRDSTTTASSGVYMYNLNTIGSAGMVRRLGVDVALAAGSASGFANNLAVYKH